MARPNLKLGEGIEEEGLAFFLRAPGGVVVAVGTAHAFELERIVRASRVDFVLAHSRRRVASATGLMAPPGEPFNAPGGSLARDFLIYALDAPPAGVRLLAAEPAGAPDPGEEVRVLGAGPDDARDEISIPGRVAQVSASRVEVELREPRDLRGWGGAPVLSVRTGRVVGLLEAFWTRGGTATVLAAPIGRVAVALAAPLEGGAGRPFAAFADLVVLRTPKPSGAAGPGAEPLLRQAPAEPGLRLRIEYPAAGAAVDDGGCGAFVAGRATAGEGELRRFDVVLVIDTSSSTLDATGVDINGNGIVGRRLGSPGSLFSAEHSDAGDSILAAEVEAARLLLKQLDPRSTRVGLVTFAGVDPRDDPVEGMLFRRTARHAETVKPLTDDFEQVERALDEILALTPVGATNIAAGIQQATIELLGLRGALSRSDARSEKVVFFFTDGQPTLPFGPHRPSDNVRATLEAADQARRGGLRIHSFAIGPDALAGPISAVEMAARTGGTFTPVRYPGDLVDAVEVVEFPELRDLVLRSATTGEPAQFFRLSADGSWGGLVKLAPGVNRFEIRALADDGTETRTELEVMGAAPAAGEPQVPARLATRRNQLLEDCLRQMKSRRAETERLQAEQLRRELKLAIERERAAAKERAAEQRRELRLEVED